MLSEQSRGVICFIEECRAQGMIKDELYLKYEEMSEKLFELEEVLNKAGKRNLYIALESLVADTINLTKDTYFEYGENFESTQMGNFIKRVNKEAM